MALNSKIIGGLAWTGLAVILAIPSADIVSAQLSPKSSLTVTSDSAEVQSISVAPMAPATDPIETASIANPVDRFEQTGKPLPSYISDAPAATAAAPRQPTVKILPPSGSPGVPVTVTVPSLTPAETEVAAVEAIAPIPAPASMRPKAPTRPITVTPTIDQPVIVEEDVASIPQTALPPVRRPPVAVEPRHVTEDQLAGWTSGSLADYLAQEGLLEDTQYTESSSAEYDADGFFLDEGPNGNRTIRSHSRDKDGFFLVFPND
jgi:hypothetical protein